MRLLLLGATGRTGRHILEQALHRGHIVHALVRDTSKVKLAHSQLHLFTGTSADINAVETAMTGCDAILSALNISRRTDFPWSSLRTPKDFLSDSMNKIVAVCNKLGCRRIIAITAWGANESKKDIPGWFRWFIDHSNIKYPYRDHEKLEDIVTASSLDYTLVRPVALTNGSSEKKVKVYEGRVIKPNLLISRRNVAKFMMQILEQQTYIRKTVTIS